MRRWCRRHPRGERRAAPRASARRGCRPARAAPCSTSTVARASVSARWSGVDRRPEQRGPGWPACGCGASSRVTTWRARRTVSTHAEAGPGVAGARRTPPCRKPTSNGALWATSTLPRANSRNAGQHRRRSAGRPATMRVGDAGEHGDERRDRRARVDQGLELAEHLAAAHLDRADLGDRRSRRASRRWSPGRRRRTSPRAAACPARRACAWTGTGPATAPVPERRRHAWTVRWPTDTAAVAARCPPRRPSRGPSRDGSVQPARHRALVSGPVDVRVAGLPGRRPAAPGGARGRRARASWRRRRRAAGRWPGSGCSRRPVGPRRRRAADRRAGAGRRLPPAGRRPRGGTRTPSSPPGSTRRRGCRGAGGPGRRRRWLAVYLLRPEGWSRRAPSPWPRERGARGDEPAPRRHGGSRRPVPGCARPSARSSGCAAGCRGRARGPRGLRGGAGVGPPGAAPAALGRRPGPRRRPGRREQAAQAERRAAAGARSPAPRSGRARARRGGPAGAPSGPSSAAAGRPRGPLAGRARLRLLLDTVVEAADRAAPRAGPAARRRAAGRPGRPRARPVGAARRSAAPVAAAAAGGRRRPGAAGRAARHAAGAPGRGRLQRHQDRLRRRCRWPTSGAGWSRR